jgi:RNA-directed DNA polymerase
MTGFPSLITINDLEAAFLGICELRKDYFPNSDIWFLRRDWHHIKDEMLFQINTGTYQFSPLNRYEFDDETLSLWTSQDRMVLKLIAHVMHQEMADHLPNYCYHLKGHGGLKKAVLHTRDEIPKYHYVMRSDIQGYYESIRFDALMGIIESYIQHPILLKLVRNALRRTETWGGNFYDVDQKGIPMGSPLSPLLGAIALIPLDK